MKTDRVRSWRLAQLARSIFLTEFISAFFLAMRYFFKPKATMLRNCRKYSLGLQSARNALRALEGRLLEKSIGDTVAQSRRSSFASCLLPVALSSVSGGMSTLGSLAAICEGYQRCPL